jgi:hypothetical protein
VALSSRVPRVVVGAFVLLTLTGCALPAGTGGSARDSRDALYGILDDTQAELGGSWINQDDPTPRGCVYPLWVKGSVYPGLRVGEPAMDAAAAIRRTRELWKKLGFALEKTRIGEVMELKGTGSLSRLLILRVGPDAMTLQGESECRPIAS